MISINLRFNASIKVLYIISMDNLSKHIENKATKSFYSTPNAKSGIFTTFAQLNKETQIKKSCIQHLPGSHYKVDLGGKMDFVIVFQAIEIERLSVEVENLRVLLKDAERQIATYLNYEVQIKELTQSYHQIEEQLKNYQCDLQKMSLACNALYEQNSQTKKAFQIQQNENLQTIKDLKKQNCQLQANLRQVQSSFRAAEQTDRQNQRKEKLISQELIRLNQNLLLGYNQLGYLREEYAKKDKQLALCLQQLQKWQSCAADEKENRKAAEQKSRLIHQNHQKRKNQSYHVYEENERLQTDLKIADNFIKKAESELKSKGRQLQDAAGLLDQKTKQANYLKQKYQKSRTNNQHLQRQLEGLQRQLEGLQKQAEQSKGQLHSKDSANKQLNEYLKQLKSELLIAKKQAQQLNTFITELKNRIDQGYNEIVKIRQILQSCNNEIQKGNLREKQLSAQIARLEIVIGENNSLNNQIFQLNKQLEEKQDKIYAKGQQLSELQIEIKELHHQKEVLENSSKNLTQAISQLENTLDRDRSNHQNQKTKLTQQFQKLLGKQQQEKSKIQSQLNKVKQQGLMHESTKIEIAALKNYCQKQAHQINNTNSILDNIAKLIQKLKVKNKQHKEAEKVNETLRKQLNSSILMNEQLIERVGTQLTEISDLMGEIYALEENLRNQRGRNDDFINYSTQKTIISTQSSKEPLLQSKVESYSYNFTNNNSKQKLSPQLPQFHLFNLSNDRKANEKSYSIYESSTGGNNAKKYSIGKLDLNPNANNLSKSVMMNEGGLFESRKALQPATYLPAREGRQQNYKGNLSYRQSASTAYQKFKKQRGL